MFSYFNCSTLILYAMVQNGPALGGVMGGVRANGPGLQKSQTGRAVQIWKKWLETGRIGWFFPGRAEENFERAANSQARSPISLIQHCQYDEISDLIKFYIFPIL